MPPAAKISVVHACAVHPPNAQVTGSADTLVGYLPAGRVGDATACGAAISAGASTVLINHRQAARLGDSTTHGGKLVTGHPNVLIGDTPQSFAMGAAAGTGKPFCEECEKARRRLEEKAEELAAEITPEDSAEATAGEDADGEHTDADPDLTTPARAGPPALDATTARWSAQDLNSVSLEALAREPNPVVARATGPTALDALRSQARSFVARSFLLEALPTQPKSFIEGLASQIDLESPVRVLAGARAGLPTLEVALKGGVSQRAFRAVLESAREESGAPISVEGLRRAESILTQSGLTEAATLLAGKVEALSSKLPKGVASDLKERLADVVSRGQDGDADDPADDQPDAPKPPRAPTLSALAIEDVFEVDPGIARELMSVELGASRWEALLPG